MHAQKQTHTPRSRQIMKRSTSFSPCIVLPSSLWKLVFLTNHSSCSLLPPPTPLSPGDRDQHQTEGVWSTRSRGEEKESNMSDFGKCSKNTPQPPSERTEAKIDLYLRASPAIIKHKRPLRKWVAVCCNDSLVLRRWWLKLKNGDS